MTAIFVSFNELKFRSIKLFLCTCTLIGLLFYRSADGKRTSRVARTTLSQDKQLSKQISKQLLFL